MNKQRRSDMQTLLFSQVDVEKWKLPDFQRPLRVNAKVNALAEELKANGGIMPGIITLGTIAGDKSTYLVDGQHRKESFRISGLEECIADVRAIRYESAAAMALEFVNLNSSLVRMRPDDLLRGLEGSVESMRLIRQRCPFVGYDQIRRNNTAAPLLGMSAVLRCWYGSAPNIPVPTAGGRSAATMANELSTVDAEELCRFLCAAHEAWGHDKEYFRLWGALNLTICMWLWRRLVLNQERGVKRYVVLSEAEFKRCLMAVSANEIYLDWLVGRTMGDRDRSPCFSRIKGAFQSRLAASHGKKPLLPQPEWAS
jgi:hypothetical protein